MGWRRAELVAIVVLIGLTVAEMFGKLFELIRPSIREVCTSCF